MQTPTQIDEVIAYFMTEYPTDSAPSLLCDAIQRVLERQLRAEVAQKLTSTYYQLLQKNLIEEFDQRYENGGSLRFRFLDPDGEKIAGIGDFGMPPKFEPSSMRVRAGLMGGFVGEFPGLGVGAALLRA